MECFPLAYMGLFFIHPLSGATFMFINARLLQCKVLTKLITLKDCLNTYGPPTIMSTGMCLYAIGPFVFAAMTSSCISLACGICHERRMLTRDQVSWIVAGAKQNVCLKCSASEREMPSPYGRQSVLGQCWGTHMGKLHILCNLLR